MLARVVQQADDVMVIQRIEGQPSGAAHPYETGASQQPELVGDRGLGHADERRQVTHATLAMTERIHETNASRITQQLEDLGHGIDVTAGQKAGADVGQRAGVAWMRFGTRGGGIEPGSNRGIHQSYEYMNNYSYVKEVTY